MKRIKTIVASILVSATLGFSFAQDASIGKDFVRVTGASVNGAVPNSEVFINGRTVTIGDLYVCDHEVTQSEYETYCKYGSDSPDNEKGKDENYPAYNISWQDAVIYCNLRSIAEGLTPAYSLKGETNPAKWNGVSGSASAKYCGASGMDTFRRNFVCNFTANGYRLPTEAEWEYIARGGNGKIPEAQTEYAGSDKIDDVAWYNGTARGKVHEVKTKTASSLGIYDMSGNVQEWCWDFYDDIDGNTPSQGADSGYSRVLRGGGWYYRDGYCTVYKRDAAQAYSRDEGYGFRVVRSASSDGAVKTKSGKFFSFMASGKNGGMMFMTVEPGPMLDLYNQNVPSMNQQGNAVVFNLNDKEAYDKAALMWTMTLQQLSLGTMKIKGGSGTAKEEVEVISATIDANGKTTQKVLTSLEAVTEEGALFFDK